MTAALPRTNQLDLYDGEWTYYHAAHLLRRTTFGPRKEEINEALSLGLTAAVDRLLQPIPLPSKPVFYNFATHPDVPLGESWAGQRYAGVDGEDRARNDSLRAWYLLSITEQGFSVRDRMMYFWVNHFGMSGQGDHNVVYDAYTTYRQYATGNFRELVKIMTIHPYMLVFLNGNQNQASSPNENFAREVLELYTLGRGPEVGPGDYTNYTEQDVTELARAFTGWRTRNFKSQEPDTPAESYYQANRHDTGDKTLSHRFNGAVITNNDEREYLDVIDLIFTKDVVATYLCRKLYRTFVYYKISAETETSVIQPLAQIMIDNDYEVAPVLRALFTSRHFFEIGVRGGIIKTPLDFITSIFRTTRFFDFPELADRYNAGRQGYNHARNTGMDPAGPPSVAGWTAYYQEPSFHRLWLSTVTLQERVTFQRNATLRFFRWNDERYQPDWLGLVDEFINPFDAVSMIQEFGERLLPEGLNDAQVTDLRELLLPGLEDFVWTMEYADYRSNPNDEELLKSLRNRLHEMLYGMLQLAEFQVN
ncbi:MAG: DUF1800 domain-containing protein [Bacteroidota bacterium]